MFLGFKNSPQFLKQRQSDLEEYLNGVISQESFRNTAMVQDFLLATKYGD